MNQAWVGGGSPEPYSAVPLLPIGSPATSASAVPVPEVITSRIIERSSPSSAPGSGGPWSRGSEASTRGACQRPSTTVAATPAIASGLTRIRPWPIIDDAWSTSSVLGGTSPEKAATPGSISRPSPKSSPAAARASGSSRSASETKAVLQDSAKSTRNGTAPAAEPSKLR